MIKQKYRKALFFVVYFLEKGKIKYLILKRKLHWKGWEFPKGGKNFFETELRTIKRELKEETGLKILKIKKFKEKGRYKYNKKIPERSKFIGQTYKLYAVEVKKIKIELDLLEHSDFKWVNFNKAIKSLTWENQKRCLKIVNNWLSLKD
jgi:8-oxo-dGTP pyrophosphatase MutT (NUDIX family)